MSRRAVNKRQASWSHRGPMPPHLQRQRGRRRRVCEGGSGVRVTGNSLLVPATARLFTGEGVQTDRQVCREYSTWSIVPPYLALPQLQFSPLLITSVSVATWLSPSFHVRCLSPVISCKVPVSLSPSFHVRCCFLFCILAVTALFT